MHLWLTNVSLSHLRFTSESLNPASVEDSTFVYDRCLAFNLVGAMEKAFVTRVDVL